MAFKLKKIRLKRKKKKKRLTKEELGKKRLAIIKKKIKSKKLNNTKLNEAITINININNDINTGESNKEPNWSNIDHYASAAGAYRKGRIDNRKY